MEFHTSNSRGELVGFVFSQEKEGKSGRSFGFVSLQETSACSTDVKAVKFQF